MTKSECQGDHHRSIDFRYSGFGIRHWNSFVILRSAFSFRPAISPPTLRLWGKSVSEAGKIDNGTTAR